VFKKKNNNKYKKSEPNNAGELFKGVRFSSGPHRPEMYLKTKDRLGLYTSTQFKN